MRPRTFLRLSLLVVIASASIFLFSYSHKMPADTDNSEDCGKGAKQKTQTEFILWESLSRNFFSTGR